MQNGSIPVPQGWTITMDRGDLFAMEQWSPVVEEDGDPAFYISGKVDENGKLIVGLRTRWNGKRATLSGAELFQILLDQFAGKGVIIRTLEGNWVVGDLEDNLQSFNQAVQQGVPQESAALQWTFTGKMAERIFFALRQFRFHLLVRSARRETMSEWL